MWKNKYADYPEDSGFIKEKIDQGKGIIGCEMHECNGWAQSYHHNPSQPSFFSKLLRQDGEYDENFS